MIKNDTSILDKCRILQENIVTRYYTRRNKKREARIERYKKSKMVMSLRTVKKFRSAYMFECFIAWFIVSYVLVFHWNFTIGNVVGQYIFFGCGVYGFAHLMLTMAMDFAVYKRTNGKDDWFFSMSD